MYPKVYIYDQRWKNAKTWADHVFGSYSQTEHIYHLANKNNIKENYETTRPFKVLPYWNGPNGFLTWDLIDWHYLLKYLINFFNFNY